MQSYIDKFMYKVKEFKRGNKVTISILLVAKESF